MRYQNRVNPFGEIVAIPQRGRWMGNRGILHEGTTIVRRWQHKHWIICETSYKDWRAPMWEPRRWTALFFLDEAVALAAGHRPCALCRRPRYNAFVEAWRASTSEANSRRDDIDNRLHAERTKIRTHRLPWRDLPVGTFAILDAAPVRIGADAVAPWTVEGYGHPIGRPTRGDTEILTPAVTVGVLAAGYRLHEDGREPNFS
jgi:hypothetical protein